MTYQSTQYKDSRLHSCSTRPIQSPHIPTMTSLSTQYKDSSLQSCSTRAILSPHIPTMTSMSTQYKDSGLHSCSTRLTLSPHITIYNDISTSLSTVIIPVGHMVQCSVVWHALKNGSISLLHAVAGNLLASVPQKKSSTGFPVCKRQGSTASRPELS